MRNDVDLTAGPLTPLLLRLAAPAALMMLLQGFYNNYVDTFFVSYLGADALAGLTISSFVLWMLFALAQLLSIGVRAKTARRLGEKNRAEADRTALRGVLYTLAWGAGAAGLLVAATPPLLAFAGATPAVAAQARAYLLPMALGLPLVFLPFMFNSIFMAAGDVRTPFLIMALCLAINSLLDPILIFGWGGFPRLGTAGAAWAAIVARLLWTYLSIRRLTAQRGPIALAAHGRLGLAWRDLAGIARIGAPAAGTGILFSAVYLALARVAAQFGPAQIGALKIGHTYEGISFAAALGFSVAAGALVGQNLGAGKPERAARAAWTAAAVIAVFTGAVGVLFRWAPQELAGMFGGGADVAHAAAVYLAILAWSQPFMGVELVMDGCFSGAGNTLPPMAVQAPLTLLRYPVAYLLAVHTSLGVGGIWWAISGSSMLKCLLLVLWFRRGRWAKTRV
jgi:putative MATE family efflux protein